MYVIGSEERQSKNFMNEVIDKLTQEMAQLRVVKRLRFRAKLNRNGRKVDKDDYLIHVRNPEAIEYLNE
jgi:hypothetical protein